MGSSRRNMKPPDRAVADFVTRVFEAYDGRLRRYLERLVGKQAVEEIAQNTYTRLYRRLTHPENVKSDEALLLHVAGNEALNHLAKERRSSELFVQAGEDVEEIPDGALLPEARAGIDETLQHLVQVIEQLKPQYRDVFVLRHIDQLSYREIAGRLNISVDAAQQREVVAVQECRRRLALLGIDPTAFD